MNNTALAERIWLTALGAEGDAPMTRHFVYNYLSEAIEVSQHAISLGLHEDTKGGFEGRLARLQKKR